MIRHPAKGGNVAGREVVGNRICSKNRWKIAVIPYFTPKCSMSIVFKVEYSLVLSSCKRPSTSICHKHSGFVVKLIFMIWDFPNFIWQENWAVRLAISRVPQVTMNTARSVWMGWGTLMVAGAAAYYFAKRDINAHRREQELKGLRGTEYLECKFSPCYPVIPYSRNFLPVWATGFFRLKNLFLGGDMTNYRVANCWTGRGCQDCRREGSSGRQQNAEHKSQETTVAWR